MNGNLASPARLCLGLLLAASAASAAALPVARDPAFVPLFTGKTLAGWHVSEKTGHGTGGRWVVEEGAIVGSQDKPGNGGILITDKAYGDFEVVLEMSNDFGPDSGLFLRSTEKGQAYQAMIDYHAGGNLMGDLWRGPLGNIGASNFSFSATAADITPVHGPLPCRSRPSVAVLLEARGLERAPGPYRRQPAAHHDLDQRQAVDGVDRHGQAAARHRRHRPPGPRRRRPHEAVRAVPERPREGAARASRGSQRADPRQRRRSSLHRPRRPAVLLAGDTAWPLFAQYTKDQAEAYLANRSQKGFTVVQGVLAWGLGSGFEGKVPLANANGDKPWLNDDPGTPNDAYFRHVDALVESANKKGLVLAMLPTWGYYVNDVPVIDATNARAYGRWLGARYKYAPNMIWVNGGDRIATGFEDVYRELARGLREGDGGAHLITYHPCGWRSSSQYFHRDAWLDFDMIETWTEWAKIYPAVLADTLLSPRKPVVLGEGAYENGPEYPQGPITPLLVRRQAWWTVMAGGFPTYGQDQMWRMAPGWDKTFDTPGADHVAKMKEIVTALPWWEMTPDQGLFATGVGSERTLNAAMRSYRGDQALAYISSQCTLTLHLDKIAAKNVRVTWIDPKTGERKDAGRF